MSEAAPAVAAPAAAPAAPAAAPAPAAPSPAPAAAAPSPAAPSPAPAAPSPAPAPAVESLIHPAPAAPAPAPAPGAPAPAAEDPFATFVEKVPEKYRVMKEGKFDPIASFEKVEQARAHLEQRLGKGDVPPADPTGYTFTMPEALKGLELDESLLNGFKTESHKNGFTQEQYQFAMGKFLESVPVLMAGAAKLSGDQARAELQKVWSTPADMQNNLSAAAKAVQALPKELQDATVEFGTNPAFLRAMAHFGQQMREDAPPRGGNEQPPAGNVDIKALERHPAYLDPKHPDHQSVSAQIRAFHARVAGTNPI